MRRPASADTRTEVAPEVTTDVATEMTTETARRRQHWRLNRLFTGGLLLVWLLARAVFEARWPVGRVLLLFVASLVPIWPFLLDRRVKAWIAASSTSSSSSASLAK